MAVVQQFNQNNNQNNQPSSAAPAIQSSEVAPQNKAPSGQPQGTRSGRFTNLSEYIKANQGYNQAGGGLAGKIGGTFQKQAGQINQGLQGQQQQFQQGSEQNRVQYNQDLANQALSNPEQFAQNQQNLDAFTKMRTGQYQGPQGLGDTSGLQQQADKFGANAQLAQNESGRFALLNQLYKTPTYNRGQQSLDNLLLQSNPNQLQSLKGLQGQAQQLQGGIQSGIQSAADQAKQYAQEAQATNQQAQEAATGAVGSFEDQLRQRAQQAQQERQGQYGQAQEALRKAASGEALSNDLASQLGLQGGQRLWGLSGDELAGFLNPAAAQQQVGVSNVANQEDVNRLQALAKLSGQEDVGQFAQVGPRLGSALNFNQEAFKNALGQQKAYYDTQIGQTGLEGVSGIGSAGQAYQGFDPSKFTGPQGQQAASMAQGQFIQGLQQQNQARQQNLQQANAVRSRYGLAQLVPVYQNVNGVDVISGYREGTQDDTIKVQ